MNIIKAGVIGCGNISKKHLEAINRINECQLVAVADTIAERAERAASQYNCSPYTDAEIMLQKENLDVVHICLPHYLHTKYAIESLKRNCHVIIEKPIAINLGDAQRIKEMSKRTGRKVMVIYQNRFLQSVNTARRLIREEAYGPIVGLTGSVFWRRDKRYYEEAPWRSKVKLSGGGAIMTQSIHTIDLLEYIYMPFKRLKTIVLKRELEWSEVENMAYAVFEHKSGVLSNLFVTTQSPLNDFARIIVYCKNGNLHVVGNRLYLENQRGIKCIINNNEHGNGERDICYGNGHYQQLLLFYSSIHESIEVLPIDDAIHSLDTVLRLYDSESSGTSIEI